MGEMTTAMIVDLTKRIADRDAEIERLREQLHYANGVCDLAMKHRDKAEDEIERLRSEIAHWKRILGSGTVELYPYQQSTPTKE